MSLVATRLRWMRLQADLTQAALARRSGVPRTVINAYENGAREPGATTYLQLANACGFDLEPEQGPAIDLKRNGKVLGEVLEFAQHLPHRKPSEHSEYPVLSEFHP